MIEPQRKLAYVVPALNNARVVTKNTFLQFPTPDSPREKRALSCPSLQRYDKVVEDPDVPVDVGMPSFQNSCGKEEEMPMDNPATSWKQLCGLDTEDRPTWYHLSVDGFPCEIPLEKLGDFGNEPAGIDEYGDFGAVGSLHWNDFKEVRTTSNHWNSATNDWKDMANHWKVSTGAMPTANGSKKKKNACLMLRGLPFTVGEQAVAEFVEQLCGYGVLAPRKPVRLKKTLQGWPSGLAEVYLNCDADAQRVRDAIHHQTLGGRYIEVLSNSRGAAAHRAGSKQSAAPSQKWGGNEPAGIDEYGDFGEVASLHWNDFKEVRATSNHWNSATNDWKDMANHWKESTGATPTANGSKKTKNACLMLRGLPFNVGEQVVAEFVDELCGYGVLAPEKPVHLMKTPQGWPSGFAEVYLNCDADAQLVRDAIHHQPLGGRYIEVLSSSRGAAAHRVGSKQSAAPSRKWGGALR